MLLCNSIFSIFFLCSTENVIILVPTIPTPHNEQGIMGGRDRNCKVLIPLNKDIAKLKVHFLIA